MGVLQPKYFKICFHMFAFKNILFKKDMKTANESRNRLISLNIFIISKKSIFENRNININNNKIKKCFMNLIFFLFIFYLLSSFISANIL